MSVFRFLTPVLLGLSAAACDPCTGVLSCGEPLLHLEGELVQRHTNAPLASASVLFVRTGGAPLEHDTLTATSDATGNFELTARARAVGEVTGWFRVRDAGGVLVDSIDQVTLHATSANTSSAPVRWRLPTRQIGRYGILLWRGTERRAAGVRVEFRRTGGVHSVPERVVATTDAIGRFPLDIIPIGDGELVGELSFQPPAPYREERITSVRFPVTGAGDDVELAGVWGVGPAFPYMGLVVWGDTKQIARGVMVEFRRTGGIPIDPEVVTMTTSDLPYGNVRVLPVTALGYGEVIGELTIRPPAPYKTTVLRDLRIETSTEDLPYFPVRWVWEIPRD